MSYPETNISSDQSARRPVARGFDCQKFKPDLRICIHTIYIHRPQSINGNTVGVEGFNGETQTITAVARAIVRENLKADMIDDGIGSITGHQSNKY